MEKAPGKNSLYTGRVEIGSGTLNVRSSPGGGVVDHLARGELVDVLADEGEWVEIAYDGGTGYAAKRYISFAGSARDAYLVIEDEAGNVFAAEGSIKLRIATGAID